MNQATVLLISSTVLVGSLGAAGASVQANQREAAVPLSQAVEAAQNALGVTDTPSYAELYNDGGNLIWEIVIGSQEVDVDADDGRVLEIEEAIGEVRAAPSGSATVTLEQAVKAAQNALGVTATPSYAKLYDDSGTLIWEVVIGDREVDVDADDAQVLEIEQVGADDE